MEITLESLGGKADGKTDNSAVFKKAFEAIRDAGGGTLLIGAGTWMTGPLDIYSRTEVVLHENAVVSFIPEVERYGPVKSRWEGVECYAMHPLIFATDASDITIRGKGVFEGNGETWWNLHRAKKASGQTKPVTPEEQSLSALNGNADGQPSGGGGRSTMFLRPPLVQFFRCTNITLQDFSLRNSPFWTIHPVYVEGLTIRDLFLKNPTDAPNTDGLDIDSCSRVTIEGCRVCVGDDGICLKSGSGPDGIRVGKPTRNVTVSRCSVEDAHGGIVIGSETAGGVHDILAEDCVFKGTDRGIRIKTRRGRGGDIHGITLRNLVMEKNLCPLAINMFYRCGADNSPELFVQHALPITDTTPSIRDVHITNIVAKGCRASAGFVAGLPESPISGLHLENCVFETDESSKADPSESDMFLGVPPVTVKSFRVLNALTPIFHNVTVKGPEKPFV